VLHRDPSVQEVRTKSAREADGGIQAGGGEMKIDESTTPDELRDQIVELYGPTNEQEREHFVILLKLLVVKAKLAEHWRAVHGKDEHCKVTQ
jgi:hypothetical protein